MTTQVEQCAAFVRKQWDGAPRIAIILGTGLGNAAAQIQIECTLSFEQIPHFPRSTALGHKGRLVCGLMKGVPTIAMEGRCHCYEGYSAEEITLPVRTIAALGARMLVVSNASGGLNPQFQSGQIMVITDHIDLMGSRGCVSAAPHRSAGATPSVASDRGFPARPLPASKTEGLPTGWCYDEPLVRQALEIARHASFAADPGVYVALTGPNYETRAEYRFLRRVGGDAVGMSTVPEVVTAAHLGLRVLALSTITNVAKPDVPQTVDPQDVVNVAAGAEPNLSKIMLGVAERFGRM